MKYNADEARHLKAQGEIPEGIKINEDQVLGGEEEEDIGIEFDIDEI